MTDKKQPVDLGLLEEDDEFEEFPAEDWAGLDEDEDAHVWEDNWDDDNVEDDFSNQLRIAAPDRQKNRARAGLSWSGRTKAKQIRRAELEKHGYKMET